MLPSFHRASSMLSTPSSAFPYGMLSNNNMGQSFHTGAFADHSEEEIVWGHSDKRGAPPLSYSSFSDPNLTGSSSGGGDFVVLSYPPSPRMLAGGPSLLTPVRNQMGSVKGPQLHTPITASGHDSLSVQMAAMSLSVNGGVTTKAAKKKKAKKERAASAQKGKNESPSKRQRQTGKAKSKAVDNPAAPVQAYPSPAPSPATANAKKSPPKPKSPSSGKMKRISESPVATGLGSRPIVDDVSDRLSVISQDNESVVGTPTLYDEASIFISRFLSSPDAKRDRICRLTLLQSLIIELGLYSSSLPASLTSARAALKSRAFINVREYIAVRAQGPEAIQKIMYPSRKALVKNIKQNKKNRASLSWVKELGLQVLLVDATR